MYYGGSLQYMAYNGQAVYFTHAPDGNPMGMLTEGNAYFYITNLQGDVVGILDAAGNLVVSYTYDAWGNLLSATGSLAGTIGALNPIRYRGYVYDTEWGLYYLQSRYYDPEIGRFINADAFVSTGQGFTGNNMFAYCGNNPVNYVDPFGYAFIPATLNTTGERIAEDLNGIVGPYNELRKLTAGNSKYEVHHLVEKRFYRIDGITVFQNNPNKAPSVILYKEEHRTFTTSARKRFPYGSAQIDVSSVKAFYQAEYNGRSDWLDMICGCFN